MRILGADETRASLSMDEAISAMEWAFSGSAQSPMRVPLGNSLVMPGLLDETLAIKVVSMVPGSPEGMVAVFDGQGRPLGVVDGPTITAIRTGAATGLATRLLASEQATSLAMLGAGAMAPDQVAAVRSVRPIEKVVVWSRSGDTARRLAARIGAEPVEDPDEAVARADVVCCATPATYPLFDPDAVRPGTHVNAIGAFRPDMAELAEGLLERAYVVVDDEEAAAAEAGDLIRADRAPNSTLRAVLAGDHPEIGEDVTVFKSVGIAAQDVAAAATALRIAGEKGLGADVA